MQDLPPAATRKLPVLDVSPDNHPAYHCYQLAVLFFISFAIFLGASF